MSPPSRTQLTELVDQIGTIIVGKRPQIEDCVACMLAGGHLLIEDVPGVGKTTLAHALAVSLGLRFSRTQFTADLMPSDLIGVSVYERSKEAFVFHPGPVFAQVLLADEINRAGPKTQSALLEAMEEHQVTVEGETRALPEPFFVIATQNPTDQLGTYPLPESQLDRFLMCITLGYPDRAERARAARRRRPARGDRPPARRDDAGRADGGAARRCSGARLRRPARLPAGADRGDPLRRLVRRGPVAARRHRACCARRGRGRCSAAATTSRPTTSSTCCRRPSPTGWCRSPAPAAAGASRCAR